MGTIVITSCGFSSDELCEKFYTIANKNSLASKKVLYITTAIDGEVDDDLSWADREFDTILNLGFTKENIIEYKIGDAINVLDFDAIYMMGGNTFYLLDKIREFGFDAEIRRFLNAGKIYIGSSAGSIIVGNSIETAWPYDENNVAMTDFTGLRLVDGIIIPHANKKSEFITNLQTDEKVIVLKDGEGEIYG